MAVIVHVSMLEMKETEQRRRSGSFKCGQRQISSGRFDTQCEISACPVKGTGQDSEANGLRAKAKAKLFLNPTLVWEV